MDGIKTSKFALSLITLSLLSVHHSHAGELDLKAGVDTEYVVQTVDDIDNAREIDSDNIIIRPFVSVGYIARDLNVLVRATHNHVRRSLDSEDNTNNYTDFNYLASYDILENLLALQVNGSQSYRSQAANSFLVDDFLLNADNLRKNTTNSAALSLNLPAGDIIGVNARINASTIDSEQTQENTNNDIDFRDFSSTNYGASVAIVNGSDIRPFLYSLDASARVSDREEQQDFENQTANLRLGAYVTDELSFRLLGYYESNDVSSDEIESDISGLREFYSYGLGFAWQPSDDRFIELGWNRSTNKSALDDEEDEEDDYLSVDLRWNFTQRTSISGNYARRFFGNSGRFNFSHSLRNWRTRISFNEDVTTNSQLLLNQEEGLLVCANGSTDLADCSLSDSLNPDDIGPNDVLVPTIIQGFELNDRVVIRKAWSAQSSVDLRRTTLTASISDGTNEEIEISREIDTLTTRLSANINISARSSVKLNLSYSDIERTLDEELLASTIKEASLEYERKLSRRFFASLGYSYLNRDGDTVGNTGGIQGINGPLTDRRIFAQIRYEFDTNN